jgi:hypothetical protein
VAIFDPEHLLDQADRLAMPIAGVVRQADLRRAISATYYALFHATLIAAADMIVGNENRTSNRYALVYRSVEHVTLKEISENITKTTVPDKYKRYIPRAGFSSDVIDFADALILFQNRRHQADYDPLFRARRSDVQLAVKTARAALANFSKAALDQREAFLTLLLFKART